MGAKFVIRAVYQEIIMWWAGIRLPVWVTRVLNQTKWTFVLMVSLQACVFWWDFSAVGPRHQWKYLNSLHYRSKPQRPPHITLKGDHWIYLLTRLRFAEQPRTIKTSPSFLCSLFNSFRRVFIRFFLFSFLSIFFPVTDCVAPTFASGQVWPALCWQDPWSEAFSQHITCA